MIIAEFTPQRLFLLAFCLGAIFGIQINSLCDSLLKRIWSHKGVKANK